MINLADSQIDMLKKIIVFSSLVLVYASCDTSSSTLKIRGNTDLPDGTDLYHLVADQNNQP